MAWVKFWNLVMVLNVCVTSMSGKLTCRTRYGAIRCEPGNSDYILRRGVVSDSNITKSIIMQLCRITVVELEAFENNPLLKEIDLSRNQISELKLGVFDGIKTLTSLRVSRNLLTGLPLGIFDQLPNLKLLDLSDNNIISFELGIFDPLTNLITLYLSGNRFLGSELSPYLFDQNFKITSMRWSNNNMSGTPENFLNAVEKLDKLELNSCSLTEFPKFANSASLKRLTNLKLQRNEIQRIDNLLTFTNLKNLVFLDLTGNMIGNINVSVFQTLTNLNTLELSFNKIKVIPEDFFLNIPSLQSLDLSYNFIEYVSLDVLLHKTSLGTLKLTTNRISFLDKNFFKRLRFSRSRLKQISVDGNPFQCACLLEILNEMKNYGFKYNSDKYDGEHAVCDMTDEFICKRD